MSLVGHSRHKRTSSRPVAMSQRCQIQTHAPQQSGVVFDHLVNVGEYSSFGQARFAKPLDQQLRLCTRKTASEISGTCKSGIVLEHARRLLACLRVALEMGESASIGDFNWIAGLPLESPKHFASEIGRDPVLCLGRHAALTSRHFLDCSNRIDIGEFATIAGARSQILTHAIDLRANRQVSAPVSIGRSCFVGTGCVMLKGARLPECSVLAAGSSLARAHDETFTLYSGVPAMPVKALERDSAYFSRVRGFVD